MAQTPKIDLKFSKNWKTFIAWFEKNKSLPWNLQKDYIQYLFERVVPNIISWDRLWNDYDAWTVAVMEKKQRVVWAEEQRQIETLMLNQLKELGRETFVLVFLNKGLPDMDVNKMSYWEAVRVKEQLIGNGNGEGGNEDIDKITIVNLNALIK